MPVPLLSALPVNSPKGATDPSAQGRRTTKPTENFGTILQRQDVQKPREIPSASQQQPSQKNERARVSAQDRGENNKPSAAEQRSGATQEIRHSETADTGEHTTTEVQQESELSDTEVDVTETEGYSFWVQYVQADAIKNSHGSGISEESKLPIVADDVDDVTAQILQAGAILSSNAPVDLTLNNLTAQKNNTFAADTGAIAVAVNSEAAADNITEQLSPIVNAALKSTEAPKEFSQVLMSSNDNKALIDPQAAGFRTTKALDEILSAGNIGNPTEGAQSINGAQESKWLGQAESLSAPGSPTSPDSKSFFQLRFNQQTLAQDLVEKTGWLVEHKLDTAQIQLDPPELGPITVKIHTHQDQVSVTFVVNNPQVRDAMDQTLQRLKDLLQDQGIMLSHADVNGQGQQRENNSQEGAGEHQTLEADEEGSLTLELPEISQGVDHFV